MKPSTKKRLKGLLRKLIVVAGTVLVTKGKVDPEVLDAVLGTILKNPGAAAAGVALIGGAGAWSWLAAEKADPPE